MSTYAIIDSSSTIIAQADRETDEQAQSWFAAFAGRGNSLVVLDLADGEVAETGDVVSVDDDGVATVCRLTVHDYQTGEELGELSAEQAAAYAAELASMTESERAVGAVDGERYGHPGRTIYAC